MAGANSWRTNIDAPDWMRDVEKRIMHEERRPFIGQPSDLMGPGLAPFAVETTDWDEDALAGNGFWWSGPGAQGTPNGVINQDWWMGQTIGNEDGFGLQWTQRYRPAGDPVDLMDMPPTPYIRRFYDPGAGGLRTYSAWEVSGGGGGGSLVVHERTATGTPTLATGVVTRIPFATLVNEAGGIVYDNDNAARDFTVPVTGDYLLAGGLNWPQNLTGRRTIAVLVNGGTVFAQDLPQMTSASLHTSNIAAIHRLTAGDKVCFAGFQNSGSTLALQDDPTRTYASVTLVTAGAGPKGDTGPQGIQGIPGGTPAWHRIGTEIITTNGSYSAGLQNVGKVTIPEEHWVAGRIFRAYWSGHVLNDTAGAYTTLYLRYGHNATNGISTQQIIDGVIDQRAAGRRLLTSYQGELPPWPLPDATPGQAYNVVAVLEPASGQSRIDANATRQVQLSVDAFY